MFVVICLVVFSFIVLSFYMVRRVSGFKSTRKFLKTADPSRLMTEEELASVKKLFLVSKVKGSEVFRLEGD